MVRVSVDRLWQYAATVLVRAGMSASNAGIVADVLSSADRTGIGSHGMTRLANHVEHVDIQSLLGR
ncbi:Ldh family oxidoreductase [Brevibacterium sp. RIT 803]|uniref:Ldh family oxidoreductase n=1 Tax=Brevibacterium sp. RIT 803 TaxID=2810210 RepID=UPI00194FFA63|nr:Ldh family oxidoreductase [Brevibacterium sp. RIT 803]